MEQIRLSDYVDEFTELANIVGNWKPIDINTLHLPRLIVNQYDLYSGEILGQNFIWAIVKDKDSGIRQIRAHLEFFLKKTIRTPVIFLFQKLNTTQQKMLMSLRINFVIKGGTIYLPDAFIVLQKSRNEEVKPTPVTLSTWATTTILYQLNTNKLNDQTISDVAELFNISKMHASRAIDELKATRLVTTHREGVSKKLQFPDKKELWQNALPYLTSPVLKRIYTDQQIDGQYAGYTALGEYTLIDSGELKTVAISKKQYAKLINEKAINNIPAEIAKTRLEVWEWDPRVINKNRYVDKFSLYLSMMDNKDDRTAIALNEILEQVIGS